MSDEVVLLMPSRFASDLLKQRTKRFLGTGRET